MPTGVWQHGGHGSRKRDMIVSTYAWITVQLWMTNFRRDIKEHNEGSKCPGRTVEETQDGRSKGDLGSHGNCFKCIKGYQREGRVALCGDPENKTMTTVWAFYSLLRWIISCLKKWRGIIQISIRQEVSFHPLSTLSISEQEVVKHIWGQCCSVVHHFCGGLNRMTHVMIWKWRTKTHCCSGKTTAWWQTMRWKKRRWGETIADLPNSNALLLAQFIEPWFYSGLNLMRDGSHLPQPRGMNSDWSKPSKAIPLLLKIV